MQAMPAQLTLAQTENVARMRTMLTYELQMLLRSRGLPASVPASVVDEGRKDDLIRIAILFDINVETLPPSLASGGDDGWGGGPTGTGASSGDDDKNSTSNVTVIAVVVAVTLLVIVVIIAGTFCESRHGVGKKRRGKRVLALALRCYRRLPVPPPCVLKSHSRLFPASGGYFGA